MPFGSIELQGLRVLTCMKTDQSGTRNRDFVYISQVPMAMGVYFPFPPKIEASVSLAELNTEDVSWEQSGTDQHKPGQTATKRSRPEQCEAHQQGAEHSCPRGDDPGPPRLPHSRAVFTAVLYHYWAVLHRIQFPFSLQHKLGISVGTELVPVTISWHCQPLVHTALTPTTNAFLK